ncbi:GTPase [Arthrobacter sp. MDT2-16]
MDQVEDVTRAAGQEVVDDFRRLLNRPPTVALAGRVNAGKSTLVNSLIGKRMAPTSAQEATELLSFYTYGEPARAEALLADGGVVEVPLSNSGPALNNTPVADVGYLRIFLQSAALREFTILDTPGLGSTVTVNSKRTESGLLAGDGTASSPDVLLYLVKDKFRPDDEAFIHSFRASDPGLKPSRPVIGLLSHSDNFGAGPWDPADPIERAREAAVVVATAHPQLADVIPVSGLLAETVRTGELTEEDVRNLRVLRNLDDTIVQFAQHLGPPGGLSQEQYHRLVQLVGGYGIRYGRDHCHSSPELARWLLERSGLTQLERALVEFVSGPAEQAKVLAVLTGLGQAALSRSWGQEARTLVEAAVHAPEFHRLKEWVALDLLREAAPHHELVTVLEQLTVSGSWPTALTPEVPDAEGYLKLAARYQAMVASASTGAEAQAARVICRSLFIRSTALA